MISSFQELICIQLALRGIKNSNENYIYCQFSDSNSRIASWKQMNSILACLSSQKKVCQQRMNLDKLEFQGLKRSGFKGLIFRRTRTQRAAVGGLSHSLPSSPSWSSRSSPPPSAQSPLGHTAAGSWLAPHPVGRALLQPSGPQTDLQSHQPRPTGKESNILSVTIILMHAEMA